MKIGTCDCCQAPNVELSRSELAGLETWSCTDGCPPPDREEELDRRAKARCLICGTAREGNSTCCQHSDAEQNRWRDRFRKHAVPPAEIKRLRIEQAKEVMPLIGPLLDAWDSVPNDVKLTDDLRFLRHYIETIRAAMEGSDHRFVCRDCNNTGCVTCQGEL